MATDRPTPGPLRIAFLGFNPLGGGFDGRGLIDAGADRTFRSLDTLGALRLVRRHFGLGRPDGQYKPGGPGGGPAGPPVLDLRVTGYSFGGWSALQLVHALTPFGRRVRVRVGLVDPVSTFRSTRAWAVARRAAAPWVGLGPAYAGRPPHVERAVNVYETKGLVARADHGSGRRLPYRARWFAGRPIPGFDNRDVSAEVSADAGHIEVAERYARQVAAETFG